MPFAFAFSCALYNRIVRILLLSFGVVASLAVGGSDYRPCCNRRPPLHRLKPTSSTQPAAAYMCPMHPDVMTTEPGKCPRCNMDLVPGSPLAMPDFRLHVETTPRVIQAGAADQVPLHRAPSIDRRAGTRLR